MKTILCNLLSCLLVFGCTSEYPNYSFHRVDDKHKSSEIFTDLLTNKVRSIVTEGKKSFVSTITSATIDENHINLKGTERRKISYTGSIGVYFSRQIDFKSIGKISLIKKPESFRVVISDISNIKLLICETKTYNDVETLVNTIISFGDLDLSIVNRL